MPRLPAVSRWMYTAAGHAPAKQAKPCGARFGPLSRNPITVRPNGVGAATTPSVPILAIARGTLRRGAGLRRHPAAPGKGASPLPPAACGLAIARLAAQCPAVPPLHGSGYRPNHKPAPLWGTKRGPGALPPPPL
ncbi:hypothetical protein [Desulforamulus putei]|uniref:hypothetical protein n=1 Tax=Desulforamulus putei TaxID=74701 RepID=UPI001160AAAA|nr:hypothetical protein [Desulforamulus putei]